MLKVEGLNAGYGSVNILWDIGFTLEDGEIVAILGSNGAGKTTMVDVYKRQAPGGCGLSDEADQQKSDRGAPDRHDACLLYTSRCV